MVVLFLVVVVISILYLHEWFNSRRKTKEIRYIREWLENAPYLKESGHILIPSDNAETKQLSAELNRLLDSFYMEKTGYEHSKKAMEQVLTNISHDMRTPLTVLKGYSELLCKELMNEEKSDKVSDMAKKIDVKANELVESINDYFTMSKIISNDMKIEMKKVNITQICHEIILEYYDILEERQCKVEIDCGSEPEYAYADEEAIKRILKNLIDNAIKHGCDGKYIALRVKKKTSQVMIEVEDHGKGIPRKQQEQIFYRNYTTAHKNSGSGLGLTIAKNLAMKMETDIEVYSEPGVRTVFTLILKS